MTLNELPLFSIFILILIVSANFIGSIFPCRVQKLLSENVIMKHILGFFTMIFFVMISAPIIQKNMFDTIKNSFLMYIFFILLTKTAKYIFLVCFALLCISYLLVLYDKQIDETDDHPDKKQRDKNMIQQFLTILYSIIIAVTLFGVIIYMGEKKIEYRKKFNYFNFFFGEPTCKGASPTVSMGDALMSALL
jgi:hypothetical protein